MSNPLVAAPVSTTRGFSGIPIAEDAVSCYEGLSSGNWVEGGLGAVATAADIADTVANPFGALFAAGAGWLMEHFEPLRQALDWLAGKPEVIASYGQTWDNVAKELQSIKTDHESLVSTDLANWQGAGADAYRGTTTQVSDALTSASSVAGGLSTATTIMGALVDTVRSTVRDLIARLVGNAVQWLLEEAFTLGLATPVVVGQITAAVSNAMAKVSKLISKVTNTIRKVTPLLEKLKGLFTKIAEKLKALRRSGEPHTATPHDLPHAKGDAPSTHGAGSVDDPHAASSSADRPFCKDDPIDIASGEVVLSQTDLTLPGVLPLVITRHHQSNYRAGKLFGPSWVSILDQRVEVTADAVWLYTGDGRRLRYTRTAGDAPVLPDFGPRIALSRDTTGYRAVDTRSGLTWQFAPTGADWEAGSVQPLSAVRHRTGAQLTLSYGPTGLPTEVRHSGGYRVAVDTDGGRVTAMHVSSPDGGSVTVMRYAYDGDGHLSEVVNSSGHAMRFTHTTDGRLTSWTDRNNEWYRYVYDEQGRATSSIGSGSVLNGSLRYEDRVTVHTDTLGNTTRYEMNERGQVVRETNPLGATTLRAWDDLDRLRAVTDPLGRTTRYDYDDAGNTIAITRPDGHVASAQYNASGQPTVLIDHSGARWARQYDERGNMVAQTDPAGATTRFARNEMGHLQSITDPLGNVTRFETTPAGLIHTITDPLGNVTRQQRDLFGRVTASVDPLGGVTRFGWTVEGKPLFRIRQDGATERWHYDSEGNQVEVLDALGQATRTEVGHFDAVTALITPDGARTAYEYDTELRLVRVTNPQGLVWRYEYDAAGNLVRENDFNGRVLVYTYDQANQLVSRTNGAGETVKFTRDALGDVVEKHTPSGVTAFERDALGRVVRATTADAELVYTRDAVGRVTAETVNGRTITFEYDAAGRRIQRRTPGGIVSIWDYDAGGKPVALSSSGHTVRFGHDRAGHEVLRAFDEVAITQSWDQAHRPVSQGVTGPRNQVLHRDFHYRPDGYLTGVVDDTGSRQLTLDPVGRVTGVAGPGHTERYNYDPSGNIITDGAVHEGTLLRTSGRNVYTYDAQGRVVERRHRTLSGQVRLWRYTWDAEDRLTAVTTPDGTVWRYRYDPIGRRIAKERMADADTVAERTEFVWDGSYIAEHVQYNETGAYATTWDYRPGTATPITQHNRVSLKDAPQSIVDARFHAVVADQVGTPTELVAPDGTIAWRGRWALWGQQAAASAGPIACLLRFPGQYHDQETGWNYNYYRYYDPETGHYASQDPLGLIPAPNPSTYVDNPTYLIDPFGLSGCMDNRDFPTRQEAMDAAYDRAGIPRGTEPDASWTVGGDPTRRGEPNYRYSEDQGSHGNYQQFETENGSRVIAEHTADPRAKGPHFHAGQPKANPNDSFVDFGWGRTPNKDLPRYQQVDGKHHYFYPEGT